jgi:hypothetical protein
MIILSGIAATRRDGTGRLLRELVRERDAKGLDVRFVFLGNRANILRSQLLRNPLAVGWQVLRHHGRRLLRHMLVRQTAVIRAPRVLVVHPQEMGMRWLDNLISCRGRAGRLTELFVLDASFFCIRSYNHLDGEAGACLLCLRDGPAEAERHHCRPFPIRDPWALTFVCRLRDHARSGRVAFWTQTEGYRELVQQFAGAGVEVRVAGLWTDDFNDLEARFPAVSPVADVVYHGSWHDAKGARWTLALAASMPERTFLFPCRKPASVTASANVVFRPLSWDTGLAEQVQSVPLCLVPSLWTAPIEGALVKSIAHAPATAVVASPHGFAAELPEGLVLRLPTDPTAAADRIRGLWPWRPDRQLREQWVRSFRTSNVGLLERLLRATPW